jgi:hypothetical protein
MSCIPTWANYRHAWALAALERGKQSFACFLDRHAIGDWGELDQSDVAEKEFSMVHRFRLLIGYKTNAGEKLWIVTEAGRPATALLLPVKY